MVLSGHLTELSSRHKILDMRIKEALQHPSIDTLEINHLKRQKLKLKDTITRLKDKQTEH
ncbi:MAG: DUF465 domain-containing protein [Pseudomonadota bacterium]